LSPARDEARQPTRQARVRARLDCPVTARSRCDYPSRAFHNPTHDTVVGDRAVKQVPRLPRLTGPECRRSRVDEKRLVLCDGLALDHVATVYVIQRAKQAGRSSRCIESTDRTFNVISNSKVGPREAKTVPLWPRARERFCVVTLPPTWTCLDLGDGLENYTWQCFAASSRNCRIWWYLFSLHERAVSPRSGPFGQASTRPDDATFRAPPACSAAPVRPTPGRPVASMWMLRMYACTIMRIVDFVEGNGNCTR
jgi:hypothetical protein